MKAIIVDPFPRQMDLIFSKDKLVYLKKNFKLIDAPIKNKKNLINLDMVNHTYDNKNFIIMKFFF